MASENPFIIKLQAALDRVKSIANIKTDLKAIEPKLPKMKIKGTLDSAITRKELNAKLKSVKPKVRVDANITQAEKKIKKIGQQKNKTTITPTVDNTQIVSGLMKTEKETKGLWKRLSENIIGNNLIRMSVQKVTQAIYQAIAAVKELDDIKTNIQIASGVNDTEINNMMKSYNQIAKELSTTTKDVGNTANEIIRMGKSLSNTNKLIENSTILAKVGMIENSQAAEYLISSMNGYQISSENSIEIIDKLAGVDMRAAVSAGGLAEAMSKCANIANSSGTSMDRLVGYMTTVGEVTQDSMSIVGNAFKSIYSRMNNIKIGKFIDDETGESLSDTEAVLNKLGIRLRDTQDTYRNLDDVLDEVGNRWKNFTQVEQNAISVAIAGSTQRERFTALMNNYSSALEYSEIAANSAGSALERYGIFQNSIGAKTNELTAAMESLSTNLISEELYSGIIQATTGLVTFLDKSNLLKASLAGIVAMGVSKAIVSIGTGFITAAKSTAQLSVAMALFKKGLGTENLDAIGQACIGLSDKQLKLILSTKGLVNGDRKLILAGKGVAETEQEQTLTALGFSAAQDKATTSTFSLKAAITGLKTNIKSAAATSKLSIAIMAVSTIVSLTTAAISKHNQKLEEMRQKAAELTNSYKEQQSSLHSQVEKYRELKETLDSGNLSIDETRSVKEQLLEIQKSLIESYGNEASNIDLVNGKYKEQLGLLSELSKENADTYVKENRFAFENAKENLEKKQSYNISPIFSYDSREGMSDAQKQLYDYIKSYSELFEIRSMYDTSTLSNSDNAPTLYVNANADDAKRIIDQFYGDIEKFIIDHDLQLDYKPLQVSLSKVSSDIKTDDTLKEYRETYDEFMKAEVIRNDTLRPLYQQSVQAVENYNEALSSGKGIAEAKANLDSVRQSVQNVTEEFDGSQEVFNKIYDGINKNTENTYHLGQAFENNESVIRYAEQLKGLTDIDLGAIRFDDTVQSPGEEAFGALIDILGLSENEVQNLIDKLVELGYVQGNITDGHSNNSLPATLSISDTITQLNARLKPALSSLQSTYKDLFTDDGILDLNSIDILSTCDSIKSKLDELNKIEGITVDYTAFEDFVRVLNNTESTEQDVETTFDSLATSITQAALTGAEDFETMKSALEDLGVANSEMVAFDALIKNTEALKEAGLDLSEATYDDIEAFVKGIGITENYSQAINLLKIQKILCAENPLSTTADIQNLYNLAQAAGITTNAIRALMTLNTAYTKASAEGNTLAATAVKGQMELVKKQVMDQFANLGSDVDFSNIAGGTRTSSKAGSSAGDAYVDAFEEELKSLDDLRSGGLISEKEYLDRLRNLYERYFKDKLGYEKKFVTYQEQYLNGYKSLYESIFSHATQLIGDRIDLIEAEKDKALNALEEQKNAAEESYAAQIKLLEDRKDALQDEIDRIREANEDRKEAIDLQEKERALAKAETQKTVLRYTEDRGFYYDTDADAIREARKELEDAEADAGIRALEKQQDALEKQIGALQEMSDAASEYWEAQKEQTEEYYDTLINRMEEYKSRWEELAGLQEQARMAALTKELGYSGEDLINENSGALEHLKLTYLGILKDLNAQNPDFLDSLSRLAGQDQSHIPGFLEGTRQAMESLAQTDTSALTGGLRDIGESLSTVASSAGDAAAAISGDGGTGMPGEPGQTDEGAGGTDGTPSLNAALRTVSAQGVEGITKVAGALAGEGEQDTSVAGAVRKVTDMLGNADPENAEPDSLMAVQKEQTREALDEEHGIPAQEQAWEALNEPLEKAAAAVTALQKALEDMDGQEYTVTIHTLGDGGALVDTFLGSYSTQNHSGRPLTSSPATVSGSSGNSGSYDGRGSSFIADAKPAPESKATNFPDTVRPLPPQYIPYPPENDHSRSAEMYRTFRAAIEDSGKMTDFLATAPKINPAGPLTGFSGGNNYNNVSNRNFYPTITGGLHITCPGVTSSEVMKQVGIALQREFHGLSNRAIQESMLRK